MVRWWTSWNASCLVMSFVAGLHTTHTLCFFGIDMSKDVVPIQIGLFQNVDTQEFMWVRLHHIYLQGAHIPTYESLFPLVIPIN